MRNVFTCLLIAFMAFGLVVNEAAAKRFGGGRSFGVQRSQSSLFSSNKASNTAAIGQRSATGSKWGGILGGLLVGGLLASLFMGNGLFSGLLSWLLVGAVIFFVVGFFRRRMQPGMQSVQGNSYQKPTNPFNNFNQSFANSSSSATESPYPAGFSEDSFLRDAKVLFNRMQVAYDQKNLQDLTAFTAPEVFGEIKMQLDERGDAPNKTEVVTLNAELLDVSKQFDSTIASVHFTGTIKENDAPLTQLDEIWHFRQFGNTKNWVVGGIQQEVN